MTLIRICREDERAAVVSIINSAAEAYRGVIPADRWHDPYMSADELDRETRIRRTFCGYDESNGTLAGLWACSQCAMSISFGMPTFCRQSSGRASAVSSCSIFGK